MLTRFSHSSLGTFRQCPRKFKFEKIDKVDVPKKLYAHTHLGNAVHRLLRTAFQWAADGKLFPLATCLEKYEAEWEKSIREKVVVGSEHMTIDDYIENGRQMLNTFYARYAPFDRGTLLGSEMSLNFQLERCPARFNARIDRLMKLGDGIYEICDYKTSKEIVRGPGDPRFRMQMGMYALAFQQTFPPQLGEPERRIEVAQYFLRHDEVIRCEMRPDELDELAEQFRTEVLATIDAEARDDWPTHESGLCDFCDYVQLCPAKRHRLALEAEEEDERSSAEKAQELVDRYVEANDRYNEAKAVREALRGDVIETARELAVTKLAGTNSDVGVRIVSEDKLPTKTSDAKKFADLSFLVRQWGLEECFALDGRVLLKEFVKRGRLDASQLEQVQEYITSSERGTVSVKKRDPDEDSD